MSERQLLDVYFRKYDFDPPSLEDAFRADPARTMERLYAASYGHPLWFTPELLDLVADRFDAGPKEAFWIFHNVAAGDGGRARPMMDLFARHFPRSPAAAQDALFYVAANDPHLLRPDLVDLACAHIPADACRAFLTLQHVLAKRPELVRKETVEAVVGHLDRQVNQAFYFIREVVKARPEFVPICTLALFECVLAEPHFYTKREMMQDVLAIAHHSHVKTELERALREPPSSGTRRARVLMALLFRQKTRALQRVLLEALDHAAKWPPVWEFLVFLIDQSDPKAVSTAAAEEFLEGAYRLSFLVTPPEYQRLLVGRLDLKDAPRAAFPPKAKFLEDDAALADLFGRVSALAGRFGVALRLTPLRAFAERTARLERERRRLESAQTTRRLRRRRSLEEQIARRDPTAAERRKLAKELADALRAESVEITRAAIRAAMRDAYAAAARHVLGREADLSRVDPGVLPAFLYYERLGRMPLNKKYLARLIEDRIEGRPHDWMRTEPPAAAWAERVKAAQPGARLERWRAPFTREFGYRAADAAREKQRRVERDLAQTRELFARLEVDKKEDLEGLERAGYEDLRAKYLELRARAKPPDVLEEIAQNLERVRIAMQMPDSDYEGRIRLDVETDPFQVLFMGEYGFASCLSIRGSNVWSAVSNAVDIDKAVVWARDGAGNIVGRRLIALTPEGVVSYRTYTNRHGLALDGFFEEFLEAYAAHCGTRVTRHGRPGPLLSDDWYDDGAI
jgi:hypothetical protein